jgi:hypothetical protein
MRASGVKFLLLGFCMYFLFAIPGEAKAERFFQKNSTWYEPIADSPGDDPLGAGKIAEYRDTANGGATVFNNSDGWGPTLWRATVSSPTITIMNRWCAENPSQTNCVNPRVWETNGANLNVPFPTGAIPSQNSKTLGCWPNYCSDGKMIIISADGTTSWDLGQAIYFPPDFTGVAPEFRGKLVAKYVAKWDLTGTGVKYPNSYTGGPTEINVPLLQGIVTYNEVVNKGVIDHAIAMSTHMFCSFNHNAIYPSDKYVWTGDGRTLSPDPVNCFKGGERVYLDSSVNCETLNTTYPMEKMVCRALQKYGAIINEVSGHGYSGIQLQQPWGQSWSWAGISPNNFYHIPTDKFHVSLPIYPTSTGNSTSPIPDKK